MPIPKWCDPKSIRTVKSGKARVLVCCPKKKWKGGHCIVGTRAIEVRSAKLARGARQEAREHPWAKGATARRIASDHLRRNPKAYGEVTYWKSGQVNAMVDDDQYGAKRAAVYWNGGRASFRWPRPGGKTDAQLVEEAIHGAVRDRESGLVHGETIPRPGYKAGRIHVVARRKPGSG